MPRRAVVLLSGGLDSMLVVRILQDQGCEVEALNFRTQFACCGDAAAASAARLGVSLSVIGQDDAYLDVIRKPEFGYGRGANPCVDCRIFMFQRARLFMEQTGGEFVASGEVLGQRPNSQGRRDLERIEIRSGLEGRLLRPLSAKLLPPTALEKAGHLRREAFFDFSGRSRKGLIALARSFGFSQDEIPTPSTGCMLTEKTFAPRVFDLLSYTPENTEWDFQLLKVGRHIRFDSETKVVVGRRAAENTVIEYLARRSGRRQCALLLPEGFNGPAVLVVGHLGEAALDFAGGLLVRFASRATGGDLDVVVEQDGVRLRRTVCAFEASQEASSL